MAATAGSTGVPQGGRPPAVLGNEVYNNAEAIFHILEHKESKCVSSLDTVTLLRGMGMNPIQAEVDALQKQMAPLIAELDEIRLEEERKKEAQRKKEEAKSGKGDKDKKEATKKPEPKKGETAKDGAKKGDGKEGEGEKEERVLTMPAEEVKNIDWHIFITSVEPFYKNLETEKHEIVGALKVFDRDGKGKISMADLVRIVTTKGESVLSQAEVKQLTEAFPEASYNLNDFAELLNGTYRPPPPPTAEEIERMERERIAEAERLRKQREDDAFESLVENVPTGGAPAAEGA
jgi:hypothetical protein